jgi:hypothetical protein
MIKFTSTTTGANKVKAQIAKLGEGNIYREAVIESIEFLRQRAEKFPAQPSRTRAKTFNTWISERGRYTIATFKGKTGKQYKNPKTAAGRLLKPSEKMLKRWQDAEIHIKQSKNSIEGMIKNEASYAVYVQGNKQPAFHKRTGWKTTTEIMSANADKVNRIFLNVLKKHKGVK